MVLYVSEKCAPFLRMRNIEIVLRNVSKIAVKTSREALRSIQVN